MSDATASPSLDEDTAYRAMMVFLEAYWERRGRTSDDIASLLGDFEIDPAMRSDWTDAVAIVLRNDG